MLYDLKKLKRSLEDIKRNHKVNYQDIAKDIGVSPSFLSQVRSGKKFFSYETFEYFCKKFNYKMDDLKPEKNEEVVPFKVGNVINHWMEARKVPLAKLSDSTNIEIFDLFDILANTKQPTKEQLNLIAKALEINSNVFEINYMEEFAKVRRSLEDVFNLSNEKISVILDFIEKNM